MKKTVVILYSNNGYDQSAKAIMEYMKKYYIDCDIIAIEETKFSNYKSNCFVDWAYRLTARNFPALNKFVRNTNNKYKKKFKEKSETKPQTDGSMNAKKTDEDFFQKLRIKLRKVDNIFMRFVPDIVICTTPNAHHKALIAKARLKMSMPIFAVLTDFCLNPRFIDDASDGYFVQNYSVSQAMQTKGVSADKIFIMGTPIVSETLAVFDKNEIKTKLSLTADLPIVAMIGGRYGCDYLKNTFTLLADYTDRFNIVILTDGSVTLKKYIINFCKARGLKNNVAVVDKIDKIAKIYSITDVLVSSPTASVPYEAMARKIPCVLIKSMNTIEKGNYTYLTTGDFALRGSGKEDAVSSILSLTTDGDFYKDYVSRLKVFAVDDVKQICRFIYDQISKYRKNIEAKSIETKKVEEKK